MADQPTRQTRQSATTAAVEVEPRPPTTGNQDEDAPSTSPPSNTPAAPEALMEATPTLRSPEEAAGQPNKSADEHALTSQSEAPSKKTKIIHKNWERVCHAVPKCDACGKKGGQVGVLQRCLSCTTQLCRECVDGGALEPNKGSAHPAVHVMDPEDIDWSLPTREEKAAQARKKRTKRAAEAGDPNPRVKGKTKPTAVKGVGLRQRAARRSSEESTTDEIPVSGTTAAVASSDGSKPPDHHLVAPSSAHMFRTRKRERSPDDAGAASQGPEKHPRLAAAIATPINNLAPLRSVMEPNPATRLPPMSHISCHSLHYGRQAPHSSTQPPPQAANRSPFFRPDYNHPCYGTQVSEPPHRNGPRHQDGEQYSAPPTPAGPRPEPHAGLYSPTQPPPCTVEHSLVHGLQHQTRPLTGYPPALRAQPYVAAQAQPQALASSPSRLHPPYPSIQDLASELYHDVLKTQSDYGWSLSICLVHEISRSWSRGALHRLAAAIGPASAGLDMLHSVADRVSDWVGLRNDSALQDWLAEERAWLGRQDRWTGGGCGSDRRIVAKENP